MKFLFFRRGFWSAKNTRSRSIERGGPRTSSEHVIGQTDEILSISIQISQDKGVDEKTCQCMTHSNSFC